MTTTEIQPERRALKPHRGDVSGRARWLAARGRNALRHRVRVAVLGTVVFLGMLVFLVLLPGSIKGMRADLVLREGLQDTVPLVATFQRAQRDYEQADSLLKEARARVTTAQVVPSFQLSPAERWKRDSLAQVAAILSRLIARVENSPLPQTYRALGESPLLRGDARVQQLLDSLSEIEREREGFGAVGGVDPMFVALTSRATAIGRAIQGIAEARRTAARDEMTRIAQAARDTALQARQAVSDSLRLATSLDSTPAGQLAAATTAAGVPALDTMPFRARADTAGVQRERAASALAIARTFNDDLARRAREARDKANTLAPPLAILAASLLLGLFVSFAFSLLLEATRPAIADAAEVERITGARVLGLVRPGERAEERDRRQADLLAPPDLAPNSRAYRGIYLHLAARAATARTVTVMGDDAGVTAAVAANIAFLAATESRTTILLDTDLRACGISSVLELRPAPGTAEVLAQRAGWSEVIRTPTIGRERSLDVVTAGGREVEAEGGEHLDRVRDELARIVRRYDVCVIAATLDALANPPGAVTPLEDVVLCIRIAETSLAALAAINRSAREAGIRFRGIVLWHGEKPVLLSREEQHARANARNSAVGSEAPALAL